MSDALQSGPGEQFAYGLAQQLAARGMFPHLDDKHVSRLLVSISKVFGDPGIERLNDRFRAANDPDQCHHDDGPQTEVGGQPWWRRWIRQQARHIEAITAEAMCNDERQCETINRLHDEVQQYRADLAAIADAAGAAEPTTASLMAAVKATRDQVARGLAVADEALRPVDGFSYVLRAHLRTIQRVLADPANRTPGLGPDRTDCTCSLWRPCRNDQAYGTQA